MQNIREINSGQSDCQSPLTGSSSGASACSGASSSYQDDGSPCGQCTVFEEHTDHPEDRGTSQMPSKVSRAKPSQGLPRHEMDKIDSDATSGGGETGVKSHRNLKQVIASMKRTKKKVDIPGIGKYRGSVLKASDLRHHGVPLPVEGMKWVPHGIGTCTDERNHNEYEGQWRLGRMHGKGTRHFFTTGDVYEGEFEHGLRHGRGTYLFLNTGDKYVGEWQRGLMHGSGKFYFACGDTYDGQWQYGKMTGTATKKLATGDVVTSDEWLDGLVHGYATKTFCRGDRYEGWYYHDNRQGFGKYIWANGEVVEGEWKNGRLNGLATKHLVNGTIYSGDFEDDKMNGQGIRDYDNGDFYMGEFRDNRRHGYGHYCFADGSSYSGFWCHGRMHGQGLKQDALSQCSYQGGWVHGTATGYGTQIYQRTGDKYTGQHINGVRHGRGTYLWRDRSHLRGVWIRGRPHGQCVLKWSLGITEFGNWQHGLRHGWFLVRFRSKRLEKAIIQIENSIVPRGIPYSVLRVFNLLKGSHNNVIHVYYRRGEPEDWRLVEHDERNKRQFESSAPLPSEDDNQIIYSMFVQGISDWDIWESQMNQSRQEGSDLIPPFARGPNDHSVAVAASTGSPLVSGQSDRIDPPPLNLNDTAASADDSWADTSQTEIPDLLAPLVLPAPFLPSTQMIERAMFETR